MAAARPAPFVTLSERVVEASPGVRVLDPEAHPFSYEQVLKAPKLQPREEVGSLQYEILHTGAFLRLYTIKGRVHWMAQNMVDTHASQDWKIHVSVVEDDLPKAWNLVAAMFMERQCQFGMKVVMLWSPDPNEKVKDWPEGQRGRELTIYIFRWDPRYEACLVPDDPSLTIGPEYEQGADFWLPFIAELEENLARIGVRSAGCAVGDRPLGTYCSIRNEAYVLWPEEAVDGRPVVRQTMMYPPNEAGWNAARHALPFALPLLPYLSTWPVARIGAAALLTVGAVAAAYFSLRRGAPL